MGKYSKEVEKKCPVCGHGTATEVVEGESNGVFGPGYHFHKTNEYYICKKCGVHYNIIDEDESDD